VVILRLSIWLSLVVAVVDLTVAAAAVLVVIGRQLLVKTQVAGQVQNPH